MPQGPKSRGRKATGTPLLDGAAPDAFFRTVVENAADMISVIDENGRVIYSNPVGKHLFEVHSGSVDRLGPELFHPDDYPLVAAEFGQLVEHGGRRQLSDHRMRSVSGNWIWVQTHAINMLDDPNVNGVLDSLGASWHMLFRFKVSVTRNFLSRLQVNPRSRAKPYWRDTSVTP